MKLITEQIEEVKFLTEENNGKKNHYIQGVFLQGEIKNITEPFKSSFGWHIAEVLDRRKEDVSTNLQRNKAYRILFERKFQEQLESTLQEMRSDSFVEIKKRS